MWKGSGEFIGSPAKIVLSNTTVCMPQVLIAGWRTIKSVDGVRKTPLSFAALVRLFRAK